MNESYRHFAERQQKRNPSLETLLQFLATASSRTSTCRIISLDFYNDTLSPRQREIQVERLAHLLGDQGDGFVGRFVICEDLDPLIIEWLGTALQIDPMFFAAHIHHTSVGPGSDPPSLVTLSSILHAKEFVNLHFHRVIEFQDAPPNRRMFQTSIVPRKIMAVRVTGNKWLGLEQHCCSILRVSSQSIPWLYLILVDPPSTNAIAKGHRDKSCSSPTSVRIRPFQGGYEDFLPAQLPDQRDSDIGPGRHSMLDDIAYYWTRAPQLHFRRDSPTLLSACYIPLHLVASEWTQYIRLMSRSVKQFEYSVMGLPALLKDLSRLDSDLQALQSWRRRTITTMFKLHHVSKFIRTRCLAEPDSGVWTALADDFNELSANADTHGKRLEAMVPVVTSFIQVLDSRRALAETANISRVTYLALVFVPLTFASSLFSMEVDNAPGGRAFWMYFAVAVPLLILVLLIAWLHPLATFAVDLGQSWLPWLKMLRGNWKPRLHPGGHASGAAEQDDHLPGADLYA
ncbi:hypothetical protein NA57DRAFT_70124 [Rhizodiscina lignyota]|uniref:Uncharacterized protein n=1 Tax=Rhizodiscina lignyota TaxID=1504668 RepID=A0A9P4IPZ0_9PEZI|nr:hypothetical protein NA57DRAFT_70124 [Rhizodiscina lignyota]